VIGYERPAPYWLSESLLRDVLHAAGGVEYHALRVIAALDESQHQYNAYIEKYPEAAWRRDVEAQHFSVTEGLSWEYPNLLTWLRTVTERIVRKTRGKRVGLLPAIADEELRADVELLLQGVPDSSTTGLRASSPGCSLSRGSGGAATATRSTMWVS
jgi:hypothetical protein